MADPIEDGVLDPSELHDEDFQFALKALLAAYQPILEEQVKEANAPEALKDAAAGKPPNCEDELALANRIFENFLTEEVAVRLLPPEGRTQLGRSSAGGGACSTSGVASFSAGCSAADRARSAPLPIIFIAIGSVFAKRSARLYRRRSPQSSATIFKNWSRRSPAPTNPI